MTVETPAAPPATPKPQAAWWILRDLGLSAISMVGAFAVIYAFRWLVQHYVPDGEELRMMALFIPVALVFRAFRPIRARRAATPPPPDAD
jgi:hypothetical protein